MKNIPLYFTGAVTLLTMPTLALAQTDNPPPPGDREAIPAPAPGDLVASKKAAGEGYLARRFGLDEAEAQRRLALEADAEKAMASLVEKFGEEFVGSYVDHTPRYGITYVFSRDVPMRELQAALPASLRPFVGVKRSRFDSSTIETMTQTIADRLASLRLAASVGYDFRTDKLEVTGGEAVGPALRNSLSADLQSLIRFQEGGSPKTMQTGARSGDTMYGGWKFHPSGGASATCTYGFAIRTSDGKDGLVTASSGHCQGSAGYRYADGHSVVLPSPAHVDRFAFNNVGRSYDYRQIKSGTIGTGPYVWFWNNRGGSYWQKSLSGWTEYSWANVNPDYPIDGGYSQVVGVVTGSSANTSNYNHPAGQVRCMGGMTTGLTCGLITLSTATAVEVLDDGSTRQFQGYVKVEGQDYMVLSYGGDSGGPVVTQPVYNAAEGWYQVRAAGLVEIGSERNRGDDYDRPCVMPKDQSCPAYYMPIDRINDHLAGTVLTTNGAMAVQ